MFSLLAYDILAADGVICGVAFDEDMKGCHHEVIFSSDELEKLRRSKFVQSDKGSIYPKIKELLEEGTQVLFCGTPCEVHGIRSYLKKQYDNLLTCDLICGCVSSPMVYKKYIEYMNTKYASRAVKINFKDKRAGWREKGISIIFENGVEYYDSILNDDYIVSFHSRYNIRPSCFNCKQRSVKRSSDITLGDFWGIENYNQRIDDNKGLSIVLANTQKGEQAIKRLSDAEIIPMELDVEDYASKYNWCLHKNPTDMPREDRRHFYEDVMLMDFGEMAKKDLALIKEERKKRKMKK